MHITCWIEGSKLASLYHTSRDHLSLPMCYLTTIYVACLNGQCPAIRVASRNLVFCQQYVHLLEKSYLEVFNPLTALLGTCINVVGGGGGSGI